jgi:predicted ATPase
MLGYPRAALADASRAVRDARELGQAATLMYALVHASLTHIHCGDYPAANAEANELVALADEKGALFWRALGVSVQGCILALTGKAADAAQMITSGITALRLTGSTLWMPSHLSYLATAHAALGQFQDAWWCIGEAIKAAEITKERWQEADIHRVAGEIELLSAEPNTAKAEECFQHALAVARAQQAKSWELRAAMSIARLWRDQGKRQESRNHLAAIHGWFTEGFDTLDLKQAKTLLDALES